MNYSWGVIARHYSTSKCPDLLTTRTIKRRYNESDKYAIAVTTQTWSTTGVRGLIYSNGVIFINFWPVNERAVYSVISKINNGHLFTIFPNGKQLYILTRT